MSELLCVRSVTEEIRETFDNAAAYEKCRDQCVKSVFSNRRAVYHAKRALQESRKAWKMVYELWPECKEGRWSYDYMDGNVTKLDNTTLQKMIEVTHGA